MITLEDVAKKARVSVMTVSRVINGYEHVRESTRERVLEAIDQLGYKPNIVAQSLVTHRSKTIAYVAEHISNPYFPQIIQGVQDVCFERGYALVLFSADNARMWEESLNSITKRLIDGAIFNQIFVTEANLKQLSNQRIQSLLIDNRRITNHPYQIYNDGYEGAYAATKYLAELGHERIAVINGDGEGVEADDYDMWKVRMEGFYQAMEDMGLPVLPEYIQVQKKGETYSLFGGNTPYRGIVHGKNAMGRLMALEKPPTAIVAQCDFHAIGAIAAITEAEKKVPDDFSVIGHDGIELGGLLYPELTTIRQPRYSLGKHAAEMLIDLIEGKEPQEWVFRSELVVGKSTASAK